MIKLLDLLRRSQNDMEKAMAPHSSILAWKIPWTEEPCRLQSMGSLRVGHNWVTSLPLFTFHFSLSCIGEGNGSPLQCSCLENPRDSGAWWAAVYGVAQSRTRLKRLSSSSKISFHLTHCTVCVSFFKNTLPFYDLVIPSWLLWALEFGITGFSYSYFIWNIS